MGVGSTVFSSGQCTVHGVVCSCAVTLPQLSIHIMFDFVGIENNKIFNYGRGHTAIITRRSSFELALVTLN